MGLYVGTSGWAYPEWRPAFYPEGMPRARFLEHLSSVLSACEINATFYRLQTPETFAGWAAHTPEHFRFATKAHRRITHAKQIGADADFVESFLSSVKSLGRRLGVVLFQFPPYRSRDDDALYRLLSVPAAAGISFACEFRHLSWDAAEVAPRIADAGGTVCVSDTQGNVPLALPPGPVAYVRMRRDRYSEEQREQWARLLDAEAVRRDVFAFAKHEGIPPGDPYGGLGLAQWLAARTH